MPAQTAPHALRLGLQKAVTVLILYRFPDYPSILQSFVCQKVDVPPEFPEVRKFIEFWQDNIEGELHKVWVRCPTTTPGVRHLGAGMELRLN